MSFFEEQDRARRATARFVLLYALAVAAIVAATNVLCAALYRLSFGTPPDWRLYAIAWTLVQNTAQYLGARASERAARSV